MRRYLMAGMACLALTLSAGQVRAQLAVIDPANLAETITMVRGIMQQVQLLQQQYATLQRTYAAVAGARNVGGIANTLGGVSRSF